MRLFVTGTNGFIGSALCAEACRRGHRVLGLVRGTAAPPAGCELARGSLDDVPWGAIGDFGPDAALHLAWATPPGEPFDSPENDALARRSAALFRGLRALGVRRIAGAGTFIEYAASAFPLVEDISPLRPLNRYARAKLRVLDELRACAGEPGVAWSWFRVFNAYGRGDAPQRLVSVVMRALVAGRPVAIRTPDSIRDFIHVDDVARGMLDGLAGGLSGPVNIGSGIARRIRDVALTAALVVDADPRLLRCADPPDADAMPCAIADVAKLRGTGWRPTVSLEEGLVQLWHGLRRAGEAS